MGDVVEFKKRDSEGEAAQYRIEHIPVAVPIGYKIGSHKVELIPDFFDSDKKGDETSGWVIPYNNMHKQIIEKSNERGGKDMVKQKPIPQVLIITFIGIMMFAVVAAICGTLTVVHFTSPIEK